MIQRLGLRFEIDDPLQRWLIVLHDTIKPTRIAAGTIDEYNDNNPLPDAIRLGNMQISGDGVGCSVIEDLHESSQATCKVLKEALSSPL
ncbi:MAG TPA: hypothetical protein VN956_07190 [Pyrinomonadaceae bacterium]|nr:hypothetical protein [Pyrinomonadaceae bacterium]